MYIGGGGGNQDKVLYMYIVCNERFWKVWQFYGKNVN